LKSEGVLTDDLSNKLNRTITDHIGPATVRTYGEIRRAVDNGYLSEADAATLAHRISTQLIDSVKPPVDELLATELATKDVGAHDGLWYGMTWMDDDPNLKEISYQADTI